MKLFQQKTVVNKCETANEFAEAYKDELRDFHLASLSTSLGSNRQIAER